MTEIGCSLPTDIIYFKLPAEKGNIQHNRYSRIEIMVLAIYLHRGTLTFSTSVILLLPFRRERKIQTDFRPKYNDSCRNTESVAQIVTYVKAQVTLVQISSYIPSKMTLLERCAEFGNIDMTPIRCKITIDPTTSFFSICGHFITRPRRMTGSTFKLIIFEIQQRFLNDNDPCIAFVQKTL